MMSNSGLSPDQKVKHMQQLADYRRKLQEQPKLKNLFIEITGFCNEHCRHCGSSCGDYEVKDMLSYEEICSLLDHVAKDFDLSELALCVTGGEPLLRHDFFDIMAYAKRLGFAWGMTSNGTLITKEVAHKLYETGMKTISVSVDGLEKTHDWFRQKEGSYQETMRGIINLLDEGGFEHVQITTVVFHGNIDELEEMYEVFSKVGVRSWRVINIEPIGRAKEQPELLLSKSEYRRVFEFIREMRFKGKMEVTYGCSHYLGDQWEREVRKWYYLCNAGIYTASVMYNGDIGACLDIVRRPELIQGNIRNDDFTQVWRNKFKIFRSDEIRQGKCEQCMNCSEFEYCAGDSFHTWDFDQNKPALCFKNLLF